MININHFPSQMHDPVFWPTALKVANTLLSLFGAEIICHPLSVPMMLMKISQPIRRQKLIICVAFGNFNSNS